jgi:hypothetical protein
MQAPADQMAAGIISALQRQFTLTDAQCRQALSIVSSGSAATCWRCNGHGIHQTDNAIDQAG